MSIAIIPARGGSKRIPRKNIKNFNGKPIIAWSIEAAKKSGLFDRVIVSTDDEEIANISNEYGAGVPFLRGKELADDFTGTIDVIADSIAQLESLGIEDNDYCCIYATAPFIECEDLIIAKKEIITGEWDYCFSSAEHKASVYRSFNIVNEGGVRMLFPDKFNSRSQDLPITLYDAAQFYWGRKKAWLNKEPFFTENSKAITLPSWRVQDIDSEDDWKRAELIFKFLQETK